MYQEDNNEISHLNSLYSKANSKDWSIPNGQYPDSTEYNLKLQMENTTLGAIHYLKLTEAELAHKQQKG